MADYSRSKPREMSAGMVRRPNLARLEAALAIGRKLVHDDSWLFDARVFSAIPSDGSILTIGNLPGFMASLNRARRLGFQLVPMAGGIAIVGTHMLRGSLSHPGAIPPHYSPNVRWQIDNVSFVCGGAETFGWHAVCEYFSLGMWDAKRIFQGYGYPDIPTLKATLDYLATFLNHRKNDAAQR